MSHSSRKLFLMSLGILVLVFGLSLTACSDSDDPTEPGGGDDTPAGDTTAPLLVSTNPDPESTGVLVDGVISAFFSEPLDPDSLDGNITLSTGTITDLVLVGGNEVEIRHEDWNEGDQVTVTFATGLADTAGNNFAEAVSYRYWVETSTVMVLETTPENGATDVLRNAPVHIKFSHEMRISSLETGITVSIPGKGDLTFSVEGTGNNTYAIIFDDTIPEDTHVMFTLSTTCETWDDEFLAEEYTFAYDTGADLDETPPEILSFDPAVGSEISPASNTLQITFSEPINGDGLEFLSGDLLTLLAMELADVYGGMNPERTVLTITFASPLPTGIEMSLDFGDFTDQSGNTNNSHPLWNVTVSGDADHYPVNEMLVYEFSILEHDGEGNYHDDLEFNHHQWVDSSNFRNRRFDQDLEVWNEWDSMIRTSNSVELTGFREMHDGVGEDVAFDNPVKILNHPTVTASWDGSVQVVTGEGTMDVDFAVEVLPEVADFPVVFDAKGGFMSNLRLPDLGSKTQPEMFWPNCRSVVQRIEGSVGGELMFTETDTMVYCPGFGLVKEMGHDVRLEEEEEESFSTKDLTGLNLYETR